jgi:hypothetical protein
MSEILVAPAQTVRATADLMHLRDECQVDKRGRQRSTLGEVHHIAMKQHRRVHADREAWNGRRTMLAMSA